MLFYYSLKQLSNHRSVNMGDKDKIKKGTESARDSYRLSDSHDSVNCKAIHLLPFDVFSEQFQHG